MKETGDSVRSFERGGGLVRVDLYKLDERVITGSEGHIQADIVGQRLPSDCFESCRGLFAECKSYGMRKSKQG